MNSLIRSLAFSLTLALVVAGAGPATAYDWSAWDAETVEVITTDEDGGARLTTVWIVIIDNYPYVRTSATTWGDNAEREGSLKLRGDPGELVLRVERVLDVAEADRVAAVFREKYGTTDRVMEWFRFGERRVFRLLE
jgi:hypothetical protein